jgi:hypothetical protein
MEQEKIILTHVITPQGELQLQQWVESDKKEKPVYEIIFNGVFLMASYNELSEKALATLAIEPLASERQDYAFWSVALALVILSGLLSIVTEFRP